MLLDLTKVNIGSGNGLVPLGNKPLPEPTLTHMIDAMASLGHKELSSTRYYPQQECTVGDLPFSCHAKLGRQIVTWHAYVTTI